MKSIAVEGLKERIGMVLDIGGIKVAFELVPPEPPEQPELSQQAPPMLVYDRSNPQLVLGGKGGQNELKSAYNNGLFLPASRAEDRAFQALYVLKYASQSQTSAIRRGVPPDKDECLAVLAEVLVLLNEDTDGAFDSVVKDKLKGQMPGLAALYKDPAIRLRMDMIRRKALEIVGIRRPDGTHVKGFQPKGYHRNGEYYATC